MSAIHIKTLQQKQHYNL